MNDTTPGTNDSQEASLPRKITEPEHADVWIRVVLRDTMHGFFRDPVHVCVAAFILALPILFSPNIDYTKIISVDAQGVFHADEQYLIAHSMEIMTSTLLSLFANVIAFGLVYKWADRMRLGRAMSLSGYMEGLATAPRILFGFFIVFLITIAACVATMPVLTLMLISNALFVIWLLVVFVLMAFIFFKWVPKFDYFLAGMGITDEPVRVLLHEWRVMPKWLWQRFLLLMIARLIFIIPVFIATLPLTLLMKNTSLVEAIPNFIVNIVLMVFTAAMTVAFVRGRDEWAGITEQEQEASKDVV